MAGNIFINYRRDESAHLAGRLHDSLARKFGHNKLFMDIDNIPVGRDFKKYLKSQIAVCDAMLAIIGPNWLTAKDETGRRRLEDPNDFIVIEIGAALAHDILIIPVLVDGARMPTERELPRSLKPFALRNAMQIRHSNFNNDAEALVKRLREALGYDSPRRRWRVAKIAVGAMALLLLIGALVYEMFVLSVEQRAQQVELKWELEHGASEGPAIRKVMEPERLADGASGYGIRAQRKREAASAQREQQRMVAARVAINQGDRAKNAGDFDKAIASFSEATRLDPKNAVAFSNRGFAYERKGDLERAIADYSEAIRLNRDDVVAFYNRGNAHASKGEIVRAIADYSEVIRVNPNDVVAFYNRGNAHASKGDIVRAIADYDEAIRLNPRYAFAFCNRGRAKLNNNDASGNEDIAKARQLDALSCR